MITTSSEEEGQAPLEIVHRSVTELPTVIPVTPEVDEPGVVMVAVPDTTVHKPVPLTGEFPDKVVLVTLHRF